MDATVLLLSLGKRVKQKETEPVVYSGARRGYVQALGLESLF
jgi:hypothetical protein